MSGCWNEDPEQRPTFAHLVQHIADVLEREAGYTLLSLKASPFMDLVTTAEGVEEEKEKGQGCLELNENEYEEVQDYETVL